MKKIFVLFFLLSTFAFAGRILENNRSISSSSQSSEEESSDEDSSEESSEESGDEASDPMEYEGDDEGDDESVGYHGGNELNLDLGGVLHEMQDALQPRSFFHGEMLVPRAQPAQLERPQKRVAEDSDDKPKKRQRVRAENSIPENLRTPMPAVGGILGALLEFGTPTWEEPFFGALDVLDILSLGAVNEQANTRLPHNLVLTIQNRAELNRLLALPTRAPAFCHLAELHFDVEDAEDEDDERILNFLNENAVVLSNLRDLTFEPANDLPSLRAHILHAAVRGEGLAKLLLQTGFVIRLTVEEEELNAFFELLPAAQRLGLHTLLDLRIYDDDRDLHRWFLERFPRGVAIHGLHFQGATFGDEAMRLLGNRLQQGFFPDLRVLTFHETGIEGMGYELLGRIILNGWLTHLESLVINNEDVEDGLADDDALGIMLAPLNTQGRLNALLPHLTHFAFHAGDGGFISDSSIHALASVIQRAGLSRLITLRLRGNLTDENIETIIQMAPHLQRLRTLDIRNNPEITLDVLGRLIEALPKCNVLSDFN